MKKLSLDQLNRISTEAFKAQPKTPIVLVLDDIRSGMNVGSAFRTADAFALQGIYLCGYTAQPPHREILKTALGATESVDWQYFDDVGKAVANLKSAGFSVWAVEQTDRSILLPDFEWNASKPIALVFGNEVDGVSEEALALVNGAIEVPQFGTKHSLNISVCLGIVVWDLFRRQ